MYGVYRRDRNQLLIVSAMCFLVRDEVEADRRNRNCPAEELKKMVASFDKPTKQWTPYKDDHRERNRQWRQNARRHNRKP